MSVPPSPLCHSVEMDVYLGQSELSGPSFLSLPDSSSPVRDSPSSVREDTHTNTHIVVILLFLLFIITFSIVFFKFPLVTGEQGV